MLTNSNGVVKKPQEGVCGPEGFGHAGWATQSKRIDTPKMLSTTIQSERGVCYSFIKKAAHRSGEAGTPCVDTFASWVEGEGRQKSRTFWKALKFCYDYPGKMDTGLKKNGVNSWDPARSRAGGQTVEAPKGPAGPGLSGLKPRVISCIHAQGPQTPICPLNRADQSWEASNCFRPTGGPLQK